MLPAENTVPEVTRLLMACVQPAVSNFDVADLRLSPCPNPKCDTLGLFLAGRIGIRVKASCPACGWSAVAWRGERETP